MLLKKTVLMLLLINVMAVSCQAIAPGDYPNPVSTLEPFLMDTSIFTSVPCEAPCWFGLELGESTEKDVLDVLQELSFTDSSTVRETWVGYWDPVREENIRAKLISANCIQPEDRQCVGLTVANDDLKIIGLFPNYAITIGDLVNSLGAPDYVSATLVPPVHRPGCSISLIWIDRQIIGDHTDKANAEVCDEVTSAKGVSPSLLIHSITYYLPEYITLAVNSGEAYPWIGFYNP